MFRRILATSGALVAAAALSMAPQATAADKQIVLIQSGAVRCSVSADDLSQGGGSTLVCEQTNGRAWGDAPYANQKNATRLNLAVLRGTSEFTWDQGSVAAGTPGQDVTVDAGQTYRTNGWTVQAEGLRTRFTDDSTGHGMYVNATEVKVF